MSKTMVEDLDVYAILNVPDNCTTQDIKKAYRKAALECHPDKRPDDADAAAKFIQLSAILKLLLDPHSRNAYDALRKARLQARIRLEKQDSVRKKLREDLERRERESAAGKLDTRTAEQKFKDEIERLRKESSQQLEAEIEAMQRQLAEEVRRMKVEAGDVITLEPDTHRLKLKWRKGGPGYDNSSLNRIFSKYGRISDLVISKKGGSALLEYEDFRDADDAVEHETGDAMNPIEVTWVTGKPQRSHAAPPAAAAPCEEETGLDFEELVMKRLHDAQKMKESQSSTSTS